MAASPVLVDSCYYIDLLRQGRDPARALAVTAMSRDLAVCGVVRCEVGRGLRNPRVRELLQAFWNVMIYIPTDNRLWAEAERTLWELDRQGRVLPFPDVVIACCARRIGATVLTFDEHFKSISGVRVIDHLEE
jgi:predicted nucleic acid-binding protein